MKNIAGGILLFGIPLSFVFNSFKLFAFSLFFGLMITYIGELSSDEISKIAKTSAKVLPIAAVVISAIYYISKNTNFFEYLGLFILAIMGLSVLWSVLSTPYYIGDAAVKGVSKVTGVDEDTVLKTGLAIGTAMVAKDIADKVIDASITTSNIDTSSVSGANVDTNFIPDTNPDLVHVDGYYRQDGTYVHSHVRTSPNNVTGDNISSNR